METKSFAAKIKATADTSDGLEEGQFEAVVSVFGNVDSYGEKVMPDAFDDTLAEWGAKGDPIPVIWSHQWTDPNAHIGVVLDAEARKSGELPGLYVKGQLDLGEDASPLAARVHALMKGRRITQFSFAYDVLDAGMAKSEEEGNFYELRKLSLFEVGPTLVGVNQDTELLGAKSIRRLLGQASAHLKAGRVLSASNESALKAALEKISGGVADVQAVLAAASDAEKSAPAVKPEASGKGEERPAIRAADLRALAALDEVLYST